MLFKLNREEKLVKCTRICQNEATQENVIGSLPSVRATLIVKLNNKKELRKERKRVIEPLDIP